MLTEAQRKAAEALFGVDLAAQIIAGAEAQTKELESAGLRYKRIAARNKADVPPELPKIDAELLDKIVQAVIAKLEAGPMMKEVEALMGRLEELEQAVNGVEKSARAKAAVELPRAWHDLQPPAPAGKKTPPAVGAAAFFTGPPRVNGNNPFYTGGEK